MGLRPAYADEKLELSSRASARLSCPTRFGSGGRESRDLLFACTAIVHVFRQSGAEGSWANFSSALSGSLFSATKLILSHTQREPLTLWDFALRTNWHNPSASGAEDDSPPLHRDPARAGVARVGVRRAVGGRAIRI